MDLQWGRELADAYDTQLFEISNQSSAEELAAPFHYLVDQIVEGDVVVEPQVKSARSVANRN